MYLCTHEGDLSFDKNHSHHQNCEILVEYMYIIHRYLYYRKLTGIMHILEQILLVHVSGVKLIFLNKNYNAFTEVDMVLRCHLIPTPFAVPGRTVSRFGSCMRNLYKIQIMNLSTHSIITAGENPK